LFDFTAAPQNYAVFRFSIWIALCGGTHMSKLRVGVIGLGMGKWHVKTAHNHTHSEVIAIADPDTERLAAIGDEHGIGARYASGNEMVAGENLDLVIVATPNKFHKPLTMAALAAGCHVICEKPMAMNAGEAEEMLEAAKKADRRLMVNLSYRFMPQSISLKREIESGDMGNIYFAKTMWLRRRGLPRFGGWFGQKALSGGGPLIDLGVHRLDLALWLMGYPEPEWVTARTYDHIASTLAAEEGKAFDVEDLAAGMITFKNGATLLFDISWAGHIKERELMETRLLGTKGGMVHRNVDEGYDFESEIFMDRNGAQYDMVPKGTFSAVEGGIPHFITTIAEDRPGDTTAEDGVVIQRLLDAIYLSAEKREPIKIGV
jgi:predicted dehydrogenase